MDADLRFVMVNEHLAAIHALPVEAHIGHRVGELLGEPGKALEPILQRVLDTGEPVIDMEFSAVWPPAPNGTQRHWLLSYYPVFDQDGRALGVNGVAKEVTAHKQDQSQLRQRERELHTIMDSMPSMIGCWDSNLHNRFANRAYHDWFGVNPGQMTGKHIRDVIGEEIYRKNLPYIEGVLRGEPQTFERAIPTPDGKGIRHALAEYIPDMEDGVVRGFYAMVSDISHLKANEEALRQSEERYRLLAETLRSRAHLLMEIERISGVGGWDWDIVNDKFQMTSQWLRLHGSANPTPTLETLLPLAHTDDHDRIVKAIDDALAGRATYDIEHRIIRQDDGQVRHIHAHAEVLRNAAGTAVRMVGAAQDITARKVVEVQQRQHELNLIRFIDGAPVAIAMFDCDMRYMAVSRRFIDDHRLTPHGLIGRSHYEVCPDIPDRWRVIHRRCLAGETMACAEDPFPRSDGPLEWVRWEIKPWYTASGAVGGLLLFSEDISIRKRAEAALVAAKAEAERANEAKSRFLAAASHDLRQPLQALSLYHSVLTAKVAPSEAPVMRHMETCLVSLSELLGDLLDLSKLDAGVVAPNPSVFAISQILDKVVSAHEPAATAKGLRLHVVNSTLTASTDPVLFERMIGNLVTNAIRYTQRGGVVVGCRRRNGTIWVEVWDSGIGIPADKTVEIFEEFRQLSNEERSREKGSGLGLAIVAKTAHLLNLEVRVASQLGRGSAFAIELPVTQDHAPPCPDAALETGHGWRVALVEDDSHVRDALLTALEQVGYQVVAAPATHELMAGLGTEPPHVVIADYRLAGQETGLDAVATVRAEFGEGVRAVILTGDTDPGIVRGIAAKGFPVQYKPLRFETLMTCMEKLMARE